MLVESMNFCANLQVTTPHESFLKQGFIAARKSMFTVKDSQNLSTDFQHYETLLWHAKQYSKINVTKSKQNMKCGKLNDGIQTYISLSLLYSSLMK